MKNDKQFDSYKKFALKTCSNYAEILNLREWDIHISFINGDGGVEGQGGEIIIEGNYFSAEVKLYSIPFEMYKSNDKEELENLILHELCHIITEPLYLKIIGAVNGELPGRKETEEVREKQTQRIANIVTQNIKKRK